MNIEEIKEKLDSRMLFESDFNTIDDIVDSVIELIESQQKTIEDMKCCHNCRHEEATQITCHHKDHQNKGCKLSLNGFDSPNLWETDLI